MADPVNFGWSSEDRLPLMKFKTLMLAALSCGALCAQTIEVRDAWVRSSVTGQNASGAFMKITAKESAKLIAATSPVAGIAEIHEMKMEGNVMTMRAVSGGLDLPAGKTVELRPGGYHLMLMDLKAPLVKAGQVPLTLLFKDAKGVESKVQLEAIVAAGPPGVRTDDKALMQGHQH